MNKYRKLEDYEGFVIDPGNETIRFACCDCGLVHDVALAHEGEGRIGMALRRHNRATAQLRRHRYGYLQQGRIKRYSMRRRP